MASQSLNIAIAAGGTAGHINPALALAEELKERGHRVCFYGQATRLEAELVPAAGYEFVSVDVSGFNRRKPWTLVSSLVRNASARKALGERFERDGKPDAAIGFGAYVELPLLGWCVRHEVPVLIHEQNSVVGLANRAFASRSARVCISFPQAKDAFIRAGAKAENIVVTGNPVRKSIISTERQASRAALFLGDADTLLVVFGGSLGAKHLNEAVAGLKSELLSRENLYVVHSTGQGDFQNTSDLLKLDEGDKKRWQLMPYIDNMGEVLAAADCVLSRAGASSIAEIAAIGVPSLLVPYPEATEDHQTTNASYLSDAGAAFVVADANLDSPAFTDKLFELIDNADLRDQMRAHARGLKQAHAADMLANELENVARGLS